MPRSCVDPITSSSWSSRRRACAATAASAPSSRSIGRPSWPIVITSRGSSTRRAVITRTGTPLNSVGAITLFVEDPQRAKSLYQEVFDPSAIYEDESSAAFKFDNLIVNLLRTPAAAELIDPATVAGLEAGSRFQLTWTTRTPCAPNWQRAWWRCSTAR